MLWRSSGDRGLIILSSKLLQLRNQAPHFIYKNHLVIHRFEIFTFISITFQVAFYYVSIISHCRKVCKYLALV